MTNLVRKIRLSLLMLAMLPLAVMAQEAFETGKWYFLTFNNSGNVITAQGEGNTVTTNAQTATNSQIWQLRGNATDGYTIINRDSMVLNVSATKSQKVKAGKNLTATTFTVVKVNNGYEVRPKGNNNVAFNQFGGAGEGKEVGLWDAGNDAGNVILFKEAHSAAEYKLLPRLIPWPLQINTDNGRDAFDLTRATEVVYDRPELKAFIEDFVNTLNAKAGTHITATQGNTTDADDKIIFTTTTMADSNAYSMMVSESGITIQASDWIGAFYALQTLKQLMPDTYYGGPDKKGQGWKIPSLNIENDKPNFAHRGFMVDEARHFFGKQEMLRVIDLLAMYKMNRLHWHLTDDQGWRIEIPEYPKLTEVGSRRSGSLVTRGGYDGQKAVFDDTPYGEGMFYTQKDLREIVAYAKARGIEIIPEIDLPGHMVAALASYPWLSCDSTKSYSVRVDGGISHDVLNIGDDRVIDFLKCVLKNVANIFPYKYIHLGGDECPTENWQNNALCLKRVQDEGLTGVNQLQSWLVYELGTYLRDSCGGKQIVVWDELMGRWNDKYDIKPVVMAWNGTNLTVTAANKGFQSIYVPYTQLYFDMMQVSPAQCDVEEGYQGGWGPNWVNNMATVYNADALQAMKSNGKDTTLVLGMQGNMWTETCNDSTELEYQLLPRLAALAENAWLPSSAKNWVSFLARLQSHDELYDALGYTYAKHYIEPDSLTAMQAALKEAGDILDKTKAGEPGYASAEAVETLKNAVSNAQNKTDDAAAEVLEAAISAFKQSPIVQPDTTSYYQILNASTYYNLPFDGASLYLGSGSTTMRVHYTKQDEPEELWKFVQDNAGLYLINVRTGLQVTLGNIGSNATLSAKGTPLRIDKATMPNKEYTYVPGAVTISGVEGYQDTITGSVKRLVATTNGSVTEVKVQDQPQLCMPGTWKLVRIQDFSGMLKSLVKKCQTLVNANDTSKVDNYTAEAITFVKDSLITPASAETGASLQTYQKYLEVYDEFEAMPKTDNGPWATNFDRDLNRSYSNRTLNSVQLGNQTITNPQTGKMYQNLTALAFVAKAGEEVTPRFSFSTGWMHGYVYVDRQNDGVFSANVNEDGTPVDGSDLMSYSFYSGQEGSDSQGYNSKGQSLSGGARNVINPPAFTVPMLEDGFYMMRWKVDWNSIDPKGTLLSGNDIISNGGDIMDVRLRVYNNEVVRVSTEAANGTLITADSATLNGSTATIGQALNFKVVPEKGYELTALSVTHGILTGDSLVNMVAQRLTNELDIEAAQNGVFTIPANLVDGDLSIAAVFGKATGITNAAVNGNDVTGQDGPVYDLQGRQVSQPKKGHIYIRNGQKIVYLGQF